MQTASATSIGKAFRVAVAVLNGTVIRPWLLDATTSIVSCDFGVADGGEWFDGMNLIEKDAIGG